MALITKIEAAIRLGIGMELLEHCCKGCPKPKQTRVLAVVETAQGDMIDEKELAPLSTHIFTLLGQRRPRVHDLTCLKS